MADTLITVLATLREKAELEDGYKLTWDIPDFKSKYPTTTFRVPAATARGIAIGSSGYIVLRRGNLIQGKDGSFPSHFRWDFVRLGDALDTVEKPPVPAPAPAHAPIGDPRQASIESQVALKGAVDLAVAGRINVEDIGSYHASLLYLLQAGTEQGA